jgi:hypothetical protein
MCQVVKRMSIVTCPRMVLPSMVVSVGAPRAAPPLITNALLT